MSDTYFEDDDYNEEEDYSDSAMQECHQFGPGGGCELAGTEYCEFECPFRDMDFEEEEDEEDEDE